MCGHTWRSATFEWRCVKDECDGSAHHFKAFMIPNPPATPVPPAA